MCEIIDEYYELPDTDSSCESDENYVDENSSGLCQKISLKVEHKKCSHKKVEKWLDGRGYCINCGETFIDADKRIPLDKCSHTQTKQTDLGVICTSCGTELNNLDFTQDWRYYGGKSRDPSRCHSVQQQSTGIKNVFEKHGIEMNKSIIDEVETRYKKILKSSSVKRRGKRQAIIAACLYNIYQKLGEYRTTEYIADLFNLDHKKMSIGLTQYYLAFPKDCINQISPEQLLVWMMRVGKVPEKSYKVLRILVIVISNHPILKDIPHPQSITAAVIVFYLKNIGKYKDFDIKSFCKKTTVSKTTIDNILKKIEESYN